MLNYWFGAGLSGGSGGGHGFRGARGGTTVQADSKAALRPEPGAGSIGMSHSLLLACARVSLIWFCQCGCCVYSLFSTVMVVHNVVPRKPQSEMPLDCVVLEISLHYLVRVLGFLSVLMLQ